MAVAALGIGIGANASVFALVHAVFIRGLPFDEPGRIINVSSRDSRGDTGGVSLPDFEDYRDAAVSFSGLAAFTAGGTSNLSDADHPPRTGDRVPGHPRTRSACSANRCCSAGTSCPRTASGAQTAPSSWATASGRIATRATPACSAAWCASTTNRRRSSASCRKACVPAGHRHVAAVAAERRPGPPRQPDALDRRPARPGRRSRRGRRRGARPGRAPPPAVSRHQRTHGRPGPDVQRLGEPRGCRADRPDVDGCGGVRPAHRLRQRRQPAARALGAPGARSGDSSRAGRHAVANRAAVAGREPPARRGGGRGRPGAGRGRHTPARPGDGGRRQAVLDDLPPRWRGRDVPRPGVRRDERAVRVRAGAARLEDAGRRAAARRGAAPGAAACARAVSPRRWSSSR